MEDNADEEVVEVSEEQLDIDYEIDDDGTNNFLFTCPACGARCRISLRGKKAGDVVACPCGEFEVTLQGDPSGIQDGLDQILGSL
jgi:hypothetical protein